MSKIQIVIPSDEFISLGAVYLEPMVQQYFTISVYDPGTLYTNRDLFMVNSLTSWDWPDNMLAQGRKVVVDNLWEPQREFKGYYTLQNKDWFWFSESLWYQHLGYREYVPNRTYGLMAFMPMNRHRHSRQHLVEELSEYLDDFIYSFGTSLPGDTDKGDLNWQRYFNPLWYDYTCFSLVSETSVSNIGFITEKTYKPIAFKHPFMVYGDAHTLRHLRSLGFETYDNLFDESYDDILDPNLRLDAIVDNVRAFAKKPYDKLTLEKIDHNHSLFFNNSIVEQRLLKEIIEPLLEYAET